MLSENRSSLGQKRGVLAVHNVKAFGKGLHHAVFMPLWTILTK
jgi:hypothetical protein